MDYIPSEFMEIKENDEETLEAICIRCKKPIKINEEEYFSLGITYNHPDVLSENNGVVYLHVDCFEPLRSELEEMVEHIFEQLLNFKEGDIAEKEG